MFAAFVGCIMILVAIYWTMRRQPPTRLVSTPSTTSPMELLAKRTFGASTAFEYDFYQPESATPIGGERTSRFIFPTAGSLYSEEIAKTWRSTILIHQGTIRWHYWDESVDNQWITVPVAFNRESPVAFLESHNFPFHVFRHLDLAIEELIQQASKGSTHELDCIANDNGFTIHRKQIPKQLLVKYTQWDEQTQGMVKEIDDFIGLFDAAIGVRRIADSKDFSFIDIILAIKEETGLQNIPLDSLNAVAERLRYYLPTTGEITVATGTTVAIPSKQLVLEVLLRGRTFEIVEYVGGNSMENVPRHYIKERSKCGAFNTYRVNDIGTNTVFTYASRDDVTLMIVGDLLDDREFQDLVVSFRRSGDQPP